VGAALLFLFAGLRLTSSLYRAGAWRLETLLLRATSNPVRGLVLGTAAGALLHSSSAVTVATVALVGGGLLPLENALGIVLGANIGTCVTVQFAAWDVVDLGLPLAVGGALAGLVLRGRYRYLALAVCGLGLIFSALYLFSLGLSPLTRTAAFARLLEGWGSGVLPAFVAGVAATAVLQSSTLFISAVVNLAEAGLITLPAAVALVLGANLGTCTDTLLAALWGNTDARRVALAHLLLNALGALVFLPLVPSFTALLEGISASPGGRVAAGHLLFNAACSLAALPFTPLMAAWLRKRPRRP
jgi:phosphate:Na+ symporter